MAEYYKYVEGNLDRSIDWYQIGKDLTDSLKKEAELREEKKAAIDEASRQYGKVLSEAPTGELKTMNEWSLQYAADAEQARLLQDRLLKSGQLKLKDYNIMRQNLTDGTTTAFNLAKEYQAEFKEKMDRAKAMGPFEGSQYLEEFLMASAEGMANFTNTRLYINPNDYKVSVAKMEKKNVNGQEVFMMSENPNDFVTVNELRNRITAKFDKFNWQSTLEGYAKGLAEVSTVTTKGGHRVTLSDPTQRKKLDPNDPQQKKMINAYDEMEDGYLNSIMAGDPFNVTSILTGEIGQIGGQMIDYTFDENDAKANPHKILLKYNGTSYRPEFSDEQKDLAKTFLRNQLRGMLKRTEESTQIMRQQTAAEIQYGLDLKKVQGTADILAMLYGGATEAEVNAAMRNIGGINGIFSVDRQGDKVIFKKMTADGKTITQEANLKDSNNNPVGLENFVTSSINTVYGGDISQMGYNRDQYMRNVNRKKYGNLSGYKDTYTMPIQNAAPTTIGGAPASSVTPR